MVRAADGVGIPLVPLLPEPADWKCRVGLPMSRWREDGTVEGAGEGRIEVVVGHPLDDDARERLVCAVLAACAERAG